MYTKARESSEQQGAAFAERTVDELLLSVLDRISDGVMLADAEGCIVYVNAPLADLFGYKIEQLVGEPIDILLPENHRQTHRTDVERFLADPSPRPMGRDELDIEGRRADGTRISVDIQLDVLPGSSLVVATVRDMTVQRQAAVDNAIVRIDLANATTRINELEVSLDLVIQRLFALGTSIAAGASNEPVLLERLDNATHKIDEVIEAVQESL